MRFVRSILAFAIALSLAMLPIGTSATGHAMSSDDMQVSMAGHADTSRDDCCLDDMNGKISHSDGYACGIDLCCVGGTLALSDIRPMAFELLAVTKSKIAIPADQVVSSRGDSPPFRPPRI